MKKRTIIIIVIFAICVFVTVFYRPFIPCIFHLITGLYCPGCGLTRMIVSMLKLDFYQAFRYNPLLFILFPFALVLIVNYIYCLIKKQKPLYKKINNKVWIVLIIVLILYGILRNIYTPLSPTKI